MAAYNSIVILGATATGKTKLAVQLATKLNGEIISVDSRQVFKGMDIGTGKDLNEYKNNGKPIPYHLIDLLSAGDRYHVDLFKTDFYRAFSDIIARGKLPIICGGTGMYLHSILMHQPFTAVPVNETLRQELFSLDIELLRLRFLNFKEDQLIHTDLSSKKRLIRAIEIADFLQNHQLPKIEFPNVEPVIFGLKTEVNQTRASIKNRLESRLNNGLIAEVEQLLSKGISHEVLLFYGLEYKFVSKFLLGELNIQELKTKLYTAICQYAKRQNTFFRKMEKDGVHVHWLDAMLPINRLQDLVLKMVYHANIINQSID
ncbi:tRNA dimethylallyltransferase [Pedobacter sp. UYP30]|uniref:tRNA (adenosine(37)-N6)-dimethylallyltransferase MiaA n=1 Tax=Pedobacter sp. UYP30 TaxID=1756400 RepID=UPI0033919789